MTPVFYACKIISQQNYKNYKMQSLWLKMLSYLHLFIYLFIIEREIKSLYKSISFIHIICTLCNKPQRKQTGYILDKCLINKDKFTRMGIEFATSALTCRRSTNNILSISLSGGAKYPNICTLIKQHTAWGSARSLQTLTSRDTSTSASGIETSPIASCLENLSKS